jgi:glyoxylase-like metal-dependent hydrolase (beta-lactamase superfamily II)
MSLKFNIGNVDVHRIVEQEGGFFDPMEFFPDMSKEVFEENLPWLRPRFVHPVTGKLILCIQSYLLRTKHHTILVDTCVGNDKSRPGRDFWDMMKSDQYERNLAAAGVDVSEVDYVMCTHLHMDHVGWNTRLVGGRWVPTFPNARYLISGVELAYWEKQYRENPTRINWIEDSVLPVVEAGLVDVVRSDHAVDDNVVLTPTPGHTIDHFSVQVKHDGQRALITGDMIHSPIQCRYPEIGIFRDHDRALGNQTRRRVLEDLCDTPGLLCTAHFASPSVGTISRWGDGFRFNEVASL